MKLRSEKLQRLTAMSVSALLAANALVLVVGLGDDIGDEPAEARPETVTFIVAEDGSRIAVDPATPEGWKAIADAQERGEQVVTVPNSTTTTRRPTTTTTRRATPAQSSGAGVTVPDVEGTLDDTLTTVVSVVDQLGETVDETVDTGTDLVDDTARTDSGDIVDPAVDGVTDTLTTTVSTLVETVTDQTLPPAVGDLVPDPPGGVPGL